MLWIHATIEYYHKLVRIPDRISSSIISQDTAPDRRIVIHHERLFPVINHCKTEVQHLDIKHVPRNMVMVWALSCFAVVSWLTIWSLAMQRHCNGSETTTTNMGKCIIWIQVKLAMLPPLNKSYENIIRISLDIRMQHCNVHSSQNCNTHHMTIFEFAEKEFAKAIFNELG